MSENQLKPQSWLPSFLTCSSKVQILKRVQVLFFFGFLSVSVALLLTQTIQSINIFVEGPTYTETLLFSQNEATFPEITICPLHPFKEKILKIHGISNITRYNYKKNLSWSSNNSMVTEQMLFELITHDYEEIVSSHLIRFFHEDERGKSSITFTPKDNVNQTHLTVNEQRHRKFGKCYSVHPSTKYRFLGIYYVKFTFLKDVKIYFHAPGQFLDLSGRMGHKFYKGNKTYTKISYVDFHQLQKDLDDGTKSCGKEEYNTCMYSKLSERMKNETEDNCTVPWVLDDEKICTKPQDINTTFWIAWNRVTNQKKDCLPPCNQLLVDVGGKERTPLENNKTSQILLYFPPRLLKSTEHYLYTILTLLAEIGGYMGLLLGYSLFNFATLVNELLDVHIEKEVERTTPSSKGEEYNHELDKFVQSPY